MSVASDAADAPPESDVGQGASDARDGAADLGVETSPASDAGASEHPQDAGIDQRGPEVGTDAAPIEVGSPDGSDAKDAPGLEVPRDASSEGTGATIEVTPTVCVQVEPGNVLPFKAWLRRTDGVRAQITDLVTWTVDPSAIAQFDDPAHPGFLKGGQAGEATVTATYSTLSASTKVRVSDWAREKLDYDVAPQDFVVTKNGRAASIWLVTDAKARVGTALREYDPATKTWSAWTSVDTGSDGEAYDARVSLDPSGDLVTLWTLHYQGTNIFELWSTNRSLGVWKAPALISAMDAWVDPPVMAANGSGERVALWGRHAPPALDGGHFTGSGGWSKTTLGSTAASHISVAYGEKNNAVAVWATGSGLSTAFHGKDTGWLADDEVPGFGYYPHAAFTGAYATVVWAREESSRVRSIQTVEGAAGSTWTEPFLLSGTASADFPAVAGASDGFGVAAWEQTGPNYWEIAARTKAPNGRWSEVTSLGPIVGSGPQQTPSIAVAPGGMAVVAWLGPGGVWIARHYPNHGWSVGRPFTLPGNPRIASRPRVGLDEACHTFLAWDQDGKYLYDTYGGVLGP